MQSTKILSVLILLFITITITITIMTKPIPTHACSCAASPSIKEELDRADSVFSGKVVNIKEDSLKELEPIKVTFQVHEIWKGENTPQHVVYTARDSAGCGFNFSIDESYLVYATQSDTLVTGICSLTKELSRADADLTLLGEGKKPIDSFETIGNQDETIASTTTWLILSIMFGLGLILLAYNLKRRT
ncbi:preprotein translocase subunit SecG [Bacillus mesophilus]|uniref:Tissue inhibitor of metalloproteinase n=1 Tax=Bacillus mesophilus TaxID=1808955 RepID=A0A6M0QBR7_9BACI|nr:hypothetical protein [Bacillus mesophilus]MBM7662781.1 preprotein translocase subunit SecG [Bacillus mesophilus]NEY73159.1 hypothetical protein [Bacillus mesophilus]